LAPQAAHPVFTAPVHEAPRQQIRNRFDIALRNFANPGFDGEHRVYQ
jgi:hypothetical protein